MSLTTALLVNLTMIVTTLLADRGTRAVSQGRLLRPLLIGAPVALFFAAHVVTAGTGLAVEAGGAGLGLLAGLGAVALARVGREEGTGRVVTRAGAGYFAFWIGACALRFAFSAAAQRGFGQDLGTWLFHHGVALGDIAAVITDAVVFSVLGMLLGRAAGLAVRARTVGSTAGLGSSSGAAEPRVAA
jgi:hypothetical protein